MARHDPPPRDPRPRTASANPSSSRELRRAPACGDVVNRGSCCGPDLGPVEDHEGPSEADVERFGGVTRTCPACGAEVYDDTAVCYGCGHAFGASREARVPAWMLVVVGVMIAGFVLVFVV